MKQLKKPSWRRQRAERQEGRSGARRDEAGAVLVLALLFVLVVSIVIGSIASWATNDLGNTTKFTNARTVQYSVSSTVNTAIGNIRYTPLFATQLLTTPTQPGYCWTPSSGSTSTLQINGVTTTVWCYTNYNAGSSSTRVVTFSACTTANESAASCAANPTLQAVVTFDDYPTGYSPPSTAQCAVYCGTGMTENSWTWFGSAVIPAATTTTTTVPPTTTTTTTTVPPTTTTTTTLPPTTTTTTTLPQSNGVTASPSNNNYNYYGGQEILALTNPSSITAMTITINVAKTTGVYYNGMFNSFATGALSQGNTTSGGYITYTFSLNGGQVIPANASGEVGVQWNGAGFFRVTSGDLWTVTSTSGGINSTISGTF